MKKVEEEKGLEYIDDLTSLYNRRYFRERLLEEKRKADQGGSSFALMMLDLDNLKPINDNYGHLTGDRVLSQVGRLLKESIRSSDILCRYAGDEFVVILPEAGDKEAMGAVERIKENFAQAPWENEKGEPIQPVTCSVGYAFYTERGSDLNGLIGWADQALYAVKRRGGNGSCGEKDLHEESLGTPLFTTPHLVGRENEVRQLKNLLEGVQKEGGKLILIHGEAGVGKTRLLKELRQVVERRGGGVLSGSCHQETRSIPYYPFREAFKHFFEERKDEGLSLLQNLPDYSQIEIARLLPGIKEMELSELDRSPDPFRLFEAVRLFLQILSAGERRDVPLFFLIEDLHWTDEATLDILRYLARNLKEAKVLLCTTYRSEEAKGEKGTSLSRFADSLRSDKLSMEIPLQPLSSEGVSTMLRLLYPGTNISADFQELLHEMTGGNPFFVEEVLRSLEGDEIVKGLPKIEEVPQSIHALLRNRMEGLTPESGEVLACGALVGKEFEFEILERVLDRPQGEILDGIEAGLKSHIVQESFAGEGERYRFVHALMADVLYSGIGKTRRRLWHGKTGEALEEVYAGRLEEQNGQLAYHFERGEKWEKTVHHGLRSAKRAKEDYAHQEAVNLYEKSRENLSRLTRESEEEEITIAQELGDVYQITGDYKKALEEFQSMEESARRKGDKKNEGEAFSKRGDVYRLQGNFDEALAYGERAREVCQKTGDQKGLSGSLNNIGIVHANRGDYEEALKGFEQSLKIRREIGDKRGVAESLNNIGLVQWNRGNYEEALKCHEESLTTRREIGNKWGVAGSLINIGNVHERRGDYWEALKCYEESLTIQRKIYDKRYAAQILNNIGIVHAFRGDYEEALRCYEESLRIRREIGDKKGVAESLSDMGTLHQGLSDIKKALEYHREALTLVEEMGVESEKMEILTEIGTDYHLSGDEEKALQSLNEAWEKVEGLGSKKDEPRVLAALSEVWLSKGDSVKASELCEQMFKIAEKEGLKGYLAKGRKIKGEILLAEARIGQASSSSSGPNRAGSKTKKLKEAETELKEAMRIADKIGALPLQWQIHASLGKVYEETGDEQKASEQFSKAKEIIHDIASDINDEKLKATFLNAKQVKSLLS
jgi:diguanylate cyclase (GGDEF)-like protein